MLRFLLGVGVGAALVYYFDVEHGANRRTQASEWMRQYVNSDTISQARQTTMNQARTLGQQISQQAGAVNDRIGQYRTDRRAAAARANAEADAAQALNNATSGANI
jgi:hypothetical protein